MGSHNRNSPENREEKEGDLKIEVLEKVRARKKTNGKKLRFNHLETRLSGI